MGEKNLEVFFKSYLEAIVGKIKEMEGKDKEFKDIYKLDREYTNKIVNDIMKNLEWDGKYYPEYFKIDHTWWVEKEVEKAQDVNVYNWKLLLAVEHENNWHDWTYEMAKLDYVICPLRVVIGFRNNDKNRIDNEAGIIKKQLEKLTNKETIDNNHEFGIILMNSMYEENEDPLRMICYRLKSDGGVEEVKLC